MPWSDIVPWVKQGPFRLFENPGTDTNTLSRELRDNNPVYYVDLSNINRYFFFNCFTEIGDDAGYDWAPDNDVKATKERGVSQLTLALNSMALSILFKHETDYIIVFNWKNGMRNLT